MILAYNRKCILYDDHKFNVINYNMNNANIT